MHFNVLFTLSLLYHPSYNEHHHLTQNGTLVCGHHGLNEQRLLHPQCPVVGVDSTAQFQEYGVAEVHLLVQDSQMPLVPKQRSQGRLLPNGVHTMATILFYPFSSLLQTSSEEEFVERKFNSHIHIRSGFRVQRSLDLIGQFIVEVKWDANFCKIECYSEKDQRIAMYLLA